MRRKLSIIISIAAAVAMLAWVLGGIVDDTQALRDAFVSASNSPTWLSLGILAFGFSLMCGVLRWRILLAALDLPIDMIRAVRLYAIGHFFNVLIPGATGGDVVKAAVAATDCPGKRPEAVASIAAERYIGMVAMFTLTGAVALFRPGFFAGSPQLSFVRYIAIAAGIASIAFSLLLFGVDITGLVKSPELISSGFLRKIAVISLRMYSSVRLCSLHPVAASTSFVLSLTNHIVCAAVSACMGHAIGFHIPFIDYLTVILIVNSVVGIPITPGGVGVREAATCALMLRAGIGTADAAALSLLYNGAVFIWAIIGGTVYAFMGKTKNLRGRK